MALTVASEASLISFSLLKKPYLCLPKELYHIKQHPQVKGDKGVLKYYDNAGENRRVPDA
jgi:hypothetical protein